MGSREVDLDPRGPSGRAWQSDMSLEILAIADSIRCGEFGGETRIGLLEMVWY